MSQVAGLVSMVQIDILDGKLTPEKSWPNVKNPDPDFVRIMKEEESFPFWEDLEFEVDLMVTDPELVAGGWARVGAKRVIFHYESFSPQETAQTAIRGFKEKFYIPGSALSVDVGLALNIDTPNEQIEPLLESVDFVQFMGIARIGFQGEPFDERVIEKISNLRSKFSNVIISVDGGVSLNSAPKLVSAGANRLVAGSAIFESENVEETIKIFQKIKK